MQKILIVEDEVALLKALKDKFEREGYTVFTAENGDEGLKQTLANQPDIILLDIIMPVKDGMTMLRELREEHNINSTPVILLTNLNDSSDVLLAMKNGVYDYLVKSDWDIDDVVKVVANKLNK